MKFQKYPSLENHYREKFINSIRMNPEAMSEIWQVQEKIHGTNFSFWSDGDTVKVASRTQFVDGRFYNCQEVIDRYTSNVLDIVNHLLNGLIKTPNPIETVAIFGELYGDGVQKGIKYKDSKDFIAFDTLLNFSDGTYAFLDERRNSYLFSIYDISQAPTLFRGSFEECLTYENEFNSTIAGIDDNVAEGVVIKPFIPLFNHQGKRLIIKSKNTKWSEKQREKTKKKPHRLDHPLQPTIIEYINTNRVDAVLSKMGGIEALDVKDFGKLLGLVSSDVVEDLIKDEVLPENWKKNDELKPLSKWINLEVKNLLMKEVMPKL